MDYRKKRREAIDAFESGFLSIAMEQSGGNVTAAARACNLDRVYFHRLLRKHFGAGGERKGVEAKS